MKLSKKKWVLNQGLRMIDVRQEVLLAENRIRSHIRETSLEYSFYLSRLVDANVYLKLENLQYTGSFKVRGALNKIMSLSPEERSKGIITASTGNHGMAVAHALRTLRERGTIYLPEIASLQKVEMLKNYGMDIHYFGSECAQTEIHARTVSQQQNAVYVSPYNDLQVIGGQGTIGSELKRQLDKVDAVYIAVGGGGLISGIAGYLKGVGQKTKIIGCSPEHSPSMHESVQAGEIVESKELPTLSDGTAGGMEPDAVTFALCQKYVDDWLLINEEEIKHSLKLIFEQHRQVIEGSAGVAVAGLLQSMKDLNLTKDSNVIVVICGGNIDIKKFKEIVM